MSPDESFSESSYEDEVHREDTELSAFVVAVTDLFGPKEGRLSAEDWLDESDIMDSPPRSTSRNWRAVTVAASARLANRVAPALPLQNHLIVSTDTKVLPIPTSNCLSSALLV